MGDLSRFSNDSTPSHREAVAIVLTQILFSNVVPILGMAMALAARDAATRER